MRVPRSMVFGLLACAGASATTMPSTNRFLVHPDTGRSLLQRTADFWKTYRDDANGGYNAVVSASGRSTGDIKYFSPQSRLAYVFTRAFMVTGDTTYLNHAEHALKFLYAHAWDTSGIGGWFYQAQSDGTFPLPDSTRWSYMQHYALLGPTVFWEAHGGQKFARANGAISHVDWVRRGSEWLERNLWDATPGREGYFTNWYPTGGVGKGFTATVDGITTHGEALALITGDSAHARRFLSLGDAMVGHLAAALDSPKVALGMPEEFNSDWSLDTVGYAMVGHIVKTVWCLDRVYLFQQDPRYLAAAEKVFRRVWANGMVDTALGGIFYDYDWSKPGSMTTRKNYWMLEQGFNAGITLASLTGDPLVRERAQRMAEGSADFFFRYFYQKNGAAIMSTSASGTGLSTVLGDEWDAGYHASEFSWLVYLYGHLLHRRDSVALFYRLAPSAESQDIRLSPMSLPGDSLAIQSVQINGSKFDRVDQVGRILHLQPGEGGVFRVVFGWRDARMESSAKGVQQARSWTARWDRLERSLRVSAPAACELRVRVVDVRGLTTLDLGSVRFPAGESSLAMPGMTGPGLRWVVLESGRERRALPLGF